MQALSHTCVPAARAQSRVAFRRLTAVPRPLALAARPAGRHSPPRASAEGNAPEGGKEAETFALVRVARSPGGGDMDRGWPTADGGERAGGTACAHRRSCSSGVSGGPVSCMLHGRNGLRRAPLAACLASSGRCIATRPLPSAPPPPPSSQQAPSKPKSPVGEMAAYYLTMQPHLFREAVDQAFGRIKAQVGAGEGGWVLAAVVAPVGGGWRQQQRAACAAAPHTAPHPLTPAQREADAAAEADVATAAAEAAAGEGKEQGTDAAADLVLYQRMAQVGGCSRGRVPRCARLCRHGCGAPSCCRGRSTRPAGAAAAITCTAAPAAAHNAPTPSTQHHR